MAGASPNTMPEASDTARVKSSTRRSTVACCNLGMPSGAMATKMRSSAAASRHPAAPPTAARSRLSVSVWRTRRLRLAPHTLSVAGLTGAIVALTPDAQSDFSKKLVALVEKEGAGYDFAHYRDAPAGLRIWCGATVEAKDVALLTQWIDWAFAEMKSSLAKAA